MSHNFLVPIVDTDSITVCKSDGAEFSPEEIQKLTDEINNMGYKHIKWELEFYIPTVIDVKAKNYILHDPEMKYLKKPLITKGASLKASNKEFYLKDFIKKTIDIFLKTELTEDQRNQEVIELYNQIAQECLNVTDISRFAFKKTYTERVMRGEGTAELKARLALKHESAQQGDKFRMFYLPNTNLCLDKNFNGEYCKRTLLKKLFATARIFETIIPIQLFTNYSLLNNYYPFTGEEKPKRVKKVRDEI